MDLPEQKLLLKQLKDFQATELYRHFVERFDEKVKMAAGRESDPAADGMREYGDLKQAQGETAAFMESLNWFRTEQAQVEALIDQLDKPKRPNAQAIVSS